MTDIRFKTHPIGSRGVWQHGTVLTLLKAIPYLIKPNRELPSFEELNALLITGRHNSGMSGGCDWKPFSLTQDEYDEICMEIATAPEPKLSGACKR